MVSSLPSELHVWVNGVDVLWELINVLCILDDQDVIHIP